MVLRDPRSSSVLKFFLRIIRPVGRLDVHPIALTRGSVARDATFVAVEAPDDAGCSTPHSVVLKSRRERAGWNIDYLETVIRQTV